MSDRVPLSSQVSAARTVFGNVTAHGLVRAGLVARKQEAEFVLPKLKAALDTLEVIARHESVVREAIERAIKERS
jgi:hypothetical protein